LLGVHGRAGKTLPNDPSACTSRVRLSVASTPHKEGVHQGRQARQTCGSRQLEEEGGEEERRSAV